jgi:RHS repeat-associated protein
MSKQTKNAHSAPSAASCLTHSATGQSPEYRTKYVYDGNLVIEERDANNLPQRSYTRGNDLSGSLQGAGGIGGLLAFSQLSTVTPQHYYYHADGNGNITCLINSSQTIAAKYLYDPYGNIASQSGSMADANPYRFSSKEFHANSGLVYYLYRFYDANLQRWINREPLGCLPGSLEGPFPIEDTEGPNLYDLVRNDPLYNFDDDGLMPHRKKHPSKWDKHTKAQGRPVGGAKPGKQKPNFKRAPGKGLRCGPAGVLAAIFMAADELNDELPPAGPTDDNGRCPCGVKQTACFLWWCWDWCEPPCA